MNAFSKCSVNPKDINKYSKDNEVELIKKGLVTNPSDNSLYLYIDEAMAEGVGVWSCKSRLILYDAVADKYGLENGDILYALALGESRSPYTNYPSPWAINVHGKSFYFKSRDEAYAAAKFLLKNGIKSFDIGLMQVNWKWHHKKFKSLWAAFQPSVNIAAGAEILLENYQETKSWKKAVKYYHNRTSKRRGDDYYARFMKNYNSIKRKKT